MKTEKVLKDMLRISIFEVFEKMYYIFLEPSSDDTERYAWETKISFSGPLNGRMRAMFSKRMGEAMLENALGVEPEAITEQLTADSLKECLNMICGNYLQKYEPDKVFHMSLPDFCERESLNQEYDPSWTRIELKFVSDDRTFCLSVDICP